MHNWHRGILRAVGISIIVSLVHCETDSERASERAEKLAEMMRHDGVERVVELHQKNIKGLLKKHKIMVVLYHAQSNDTLLRQEKYALEVLVNLSSICCWLGDLKSFC